MLIVEKCKTDRENRYVRHKVKSPYMKATSTNTKQLKFQITPYKC